MHDVALQFGLGAWKQGLIVRDILQTEAKALQGVL
jgi:hypothetical protein